MFSTMVSLHAVLPVLPLLSVVIQPTLSGGVVFLWDGCSCFFVGCYVLCLVPWCHFMQCYQCYLYSQLLYSRHCLVVLFACGMAVAVPLLVIVYYV